MPTADEVIVEFEARVGKYEADLRRASRTFDDATRRQQQGMDRFERQMQGSTGRIGGYLKGMLAGVVTVGAARELLRIADVAKNVEAQLRLATAATGSFAQAQDDVRRIAGETRSGLEETTQLYATFQRNAAELGITQEQAARATETVTKAFQISGASAAEAAGGLRQFLQGLQSGALRGEELNSVLENAPRLAKLLADGLGVTVGQLRELGKEGDLAADKLIKALTDRQFTAGIDAEFQQLPVTFDQAMTQIESAAIVVFGAFDRGGQFSTALANFIVDGTGGFADLESAAESFGRTVSGEFAGIIAVGNQVIGVLQGITSVLNWIDSNSGGILGRAAEFAQSSGLAYGPAGIIVQTVRRSPVYQQAAANRERDLRGQAMEQWLRETVPLDRTLNGTPGISPRGSSAAGGKPPPRRSGPSAETLANRAAAEARKAEQERLAAIRDEASKQQELARLQNDLVAARGALLRASEDILAFELGQVDAEKNERLARYQTEVRLGDLTQAEYNQRAELLEQTALADKQKLLLAKAEADLAQAQAQDLESRQDALASLEAEAQLADTREERVAVERNLLDLAYDLEEAAIRQDAANSDIADLDEALANLKRRRLANEEGLRRDNMSPFERYRADIDKTRGEINDDLEVVAINGIEALNDGLVDAIVNFENLGDVARKIIQQIAADLVRLAIQQAISAAIGAALGGGGGGLAKTVGMAGTGALKGFARGTNFAPGGVAMVGEEGPEAVYLPRGSKVIPNHRLNLPTGLLSAPGCTSGGTADNRSFTIHNSFPGVRDRETAREAGGQMARRIRRELNGPTRAS